MPHTIGGEQEIRRVLLRQPSYLIDLLLNLQALQVIELWLVALEGAVDIVLSPAVGLVLALRRDREELKVLAARSGLSRVCDGECRAECPGTASSDNTPGVLSGNGDEMEREWSGNRVGMRGNGAETE